MGIEHRTKKPNFLDLKFNLSKALLWSILVFGGSIILSIPLMDRSWRLALALSVTGGVAGFFYGAKTPPSVRWQKGYRGDKTDEVLNNVAATTGLLTGVMPHRPYVPISEELSVGRFLLYLAIFVAMIAATVYIPQFRHWIAEHG